MIHTRIIIVTITLLITATLRAEPGKLRVGAAAVDITPTEFPINTPGGFSPRGTTSAHDPLHARAMCLSDGETTIVMAVVDSLGTGPDVLDKAKAIASEKTGVPLTRMLVSSTHTHSAPPSGRTEGRAADVAYHHKFVNGLAEAIIQAHANLRPASIGDASHPLPEEVFNRRWYLKPGKMPPNPFGGMDKVKMNPGRSPEVLDRPAGPTDPDIMVIAARDERRKPVVLFANYALHYVGGIPAGTVSADYFGEFARVMPVRVRGPEGFVSMMSNGASGDINNIPFTVTRPPREPFEQVRIVARKAADTAWFAWKKIDYADRVPLGMVERKITLRYRKPTDEQIAWAKKVTAMLKADPQALKKLPRRADSYARRTLNAAKRPDTLDVQLQAIRIGDLAVVGIPFEVLVEIGLDLKQRSPLPRTMIIGLANGRHGYLPPPHQHELGGYETWLGTCHVQEDASVIITKSLLEMLNELAK